MPPGGFPNELLALSTQDSVLEYRVVQKAPTSLSTGRERLASGVHSLQQELGTSPGRIRPNTPNLRSPPSLPREQSLVRGSALPGPRCSGVDSGTLLTSNKKSGAKETQFLGDQASEDLPCSSSLPFFSQIRGNAVPSQDRSRARGTRSSSKLCPPAAPRFLRPGRYSPPSLRTGDAGVASTLQVGPVLRCPRSDGPMITGTTGGRGTESESGSSEERRLRRAQLREEAYVWERRCCALLPDTQKSLGPPGGCFQRLLQQPP